MNPITLYLFKLKKSVTSNDIFESVTRLLMVLANMNVETTRTSNANVAMIHLPAPLTLRSRSIWLPSFDHAKTVIHENNRELINRSPRVRLTILVPYTAGSNNSNWRNSNTSG